MGGLHQSHADPAMAFGQGLKAYWGLGTKH